MSIKKTDLLLRAISVGLKQGFIILSSFIAAKLLSLSEYGEFSYMMTVFSVALMIADFGLSTAITKFVAQKQERTYAATVLSTALILTGVFLLLSIGGVIAGIWLRLIILSYSSALLLLVAVACALITTVFEGVLRGLQEYTQSAIATSVATVLTIPALWWGLTSFGVVGALCATVLYWVLCVVTLGILSKLPLSSFTVQKKLMQQIFSYAMQFGIAAMSYFLFSRYIVFVLGSHQEWDSLAVYDLLSKVMLLFTFPLSIYGQVLAPVFAKEPYSSDKNAVKKQLTTYTVLLTVISFAVMVLFILVALVIPHILPAYGAFREYSLLVWVSAALLFIFSWTNMIDTGILVPTGYASIMTVVYPLIGAVSVFLLPFLYTTGGIVFLFWGIVGLQAIMAVSVRILFYHRLSS